MEKEIGKQRVCLGVVRILLQLLEQGLFRYLRLIGFHVEHSVGGLAERTLGIKFGCLREVLRGLLIL